jgi:2-keto-3-deoxy-L-rhamnonate aldolase RhmA
MRPTPARELNPALDRATIVQILLETPEGIRNAEAIAALDGVDMLAIGANDLTAELGVPGQYGHPALRDAIAAVGEACKRHDKLLMVGGIADQAVLDSLPALGVSPLHLTGFDTDLLFSAAQSRAARFTEH